MATGTKCPSKSNVRLSIENQIKGVEKEPTLGVHFTEVSVLV